MATLLAFHAHPDDEVLLTGGVLAGAAADGHRVVIVVACDGLMGPASDGDTPRLGELRASARALGVHRVVHLGYADSGHGAILYPDPPDRARFARADTEEAAERLAVILREEKVDLLLSYDANGGYGHRDHVKVHEVGKRAAQLGGVPRVWEATLPREPIARVVKALQLVGALRRYDPGAMRSAYTPRAAITHRIDVRRSARRKRAALAAHRSQLAGPGRAAPLLRVLARLPVPVFGLLMGREWFTEAPSPRRTETPVSPVESRGSASSRSRTPAPTPEGLIKSLKPRSKGAQARIERSSGNRRPGHHV